MNEHESFVAENVERVGSDPEFKAASQEWLRHAVRLQYGYNFSWMGRPIIQVPQDIYAVQELIWSSRPDLVIETGIAHGGSLILSASMLAHLDYCDAAEAGASLVPQASQRKVLGVDIDIRAHNKKAIEEHPMSHLIEMIEGSSVDADIVSRVHEAAKGYSKVLVMLDSNHTHEHVLGELKAYAPLVTPGSYCVIWDSGIEDLPSGKVFDRPWGKGNNPKTALQQYLKSLQDDVVVAKDGKTLKFEVDKILEYKLAVSASSDGFLRRV